MTHLTTEQLEAGLDEIRASPVGAGTLEMIVRRPAIDEREVLDSGELDLSVGLVGDTWQDRPSRRLDFRAPHPEMQLNVINARAIALIAGSRDRWPLAGDQLYVDLHLGTDELPRGHAVADRRRRHRDHRDPAHRVRQVHRSASGSRRCASSTRPRAGGSTSVGSTPRWSCRARSARATGSTAADELAPQRARPMSRRAVADRMAGAAADLLALARRRATGAPRRGRSRPTTNAGSGSTRRSTTAGCRWARCGHASSSWRCACWRPGCRRQASSRPPRSSGWRTCSTSWSASSSATVASAAAIPACTTCASSADRSPARAGAGASAGTTCPSTTPSSTARSPPRRRASSAPTRPRHRCSARTCCVRSPAPRTSVAS